MEPKTGTAGRANSLLCIAAPKKITVVLPTQVRGLEEQERQYLSSQTDTNVSNWGFGAQKRWLAAQGGSFELQFAHSCHVSSNPSKKRGNNQPQPASFLSKYSSPKELPDIVAPSSPPSSQHSCIHLNLTTCAIMMQPWSALLACTSLLRV